MKKIIHLALLVVSFSANSATVSGNDFLNLLNSKDRTEFLGAMSYIEMLAKALDKSSFCLPENIRLTELRDVVKEDLTNNPKDRNQPVNNLVANSLKKAFPCTSK